MRKWLYYVFGIVVLTGFFVSCSPLESDVEDAKKSEDLISEKQLISYFGFKVADNPQLPADVTGVISGDTIVVAMKNKVDLSALKSSFTVNGGAVVKIDDVIQISGGTAGSFYKKRDMTITGADGTMASYTVIVDYDKKNYAKPEGLMVNAACNEGRFIYNDISSTYSDGEFAFDFANEAVVSKVKLSFTLLNGFSVADSNGKPIVSEVTEFDLTSSNKLCVTSPDGNIYSFTIVSTRSGYIDIQSFKEYLDTLTMEGMKKLTAITPVLPSGYTFSITGNKNIDIVSGFTPAKPVEGTTASVTYLLERTGDKATFTSTVSIVIPVTVVDPGNPDVPSVGGVIIYGFAPSGPAGINDECVILYNNSGKSIDLAGYRIKYASASGVTVITKYIFADKTCVIDSGKYLLIAGASFVKSGWSGNNEPDLIDVDDFTFSGTSGHVILADDENNEIDRVGYGEGLRPEAKCVAYNSSEGLIYRKDPVADTNNNFADFLSPSAKGGTLRNSKN